MVAKGRAPDCRGEANGRARLTAEQVTAIRDEPLLQRQIALKYGIERSAVSRIRARKLWRSVP
jgi:predicted XRE-type DNA-binding protein